jgi:hypothetical protein
MQERERASRFIAGKCAALPCRVSRPQLRLARSARIAVIGSGERLEIGVDLSQIPDLLARPTH